MASWGCKSLRPLVEQLPVVPVTCDDVLLAPDDELSRCYHCCWARPLMNNNGQNSSANLLNKRQQ